MVNARINRIKPKEASIELKKSKDYNLIATSYHEASHAIAALIYYFYVFNTNIISTKKQYGDTGWYWFDYYTDLNSNDTLYSIIYLSELKSLYAGLIGEKLYYFNACGSDKFPMHLKKDSRYDYRLASGLIKKQNLAKPGKETAILKKSIHNEMKALLQEHWDAVKIVAHALYKKKRLSFSEIKHILLYKTSHKDFWKEKFKKIKIIHNENNLPSIIEVKKLIQ